MQRCDGNNPSGETVLDSGTRYRRHFRSLLLCAIVVFGLTAPSAGIAGASPTAATVNDELEPNDTMENATAVEDGDEYDDLTLTEDDVDYFAIELDEGETVSAGINFSHDDADLDLELQDENGQTLDVSASVTDDERIRYTAEESATVYVRAYAYSGAPADYSFSVSLVEPPEPDELEPNDELAAATAVSDGDSYDGLTLTAGDNDFFSVELDQGEQLSVDLAFDHEAADAGAVVLSPLGQPAVSGTASADDGDITYIAQGNGTHYVRVVSMTGTNEYDVDFSVSDGPSGDALEPNNEQATATEVEDGDEYDDLSIIGNDVDFFAVDLEEGETISAEMVFSHQQADLDVAITNEAGERLTSSASVSDDETVRYTATEDGTYYVRAYSFQGTANYSISFNVSEGPVGDGLEPNDEMTSATQVSAGDEFSNLSVTRNDVDFFAIEADAGETISADVAFSHEDADIDVVLVDENRQDLDYSASVSDDEHVEATVTEAGTYYLRVFAFDGSADYDLSVNVTEGPTGDRFERNDDVASSTLVSDGDAYDNLSIHTEDDVDMFRVDLEEGETLTAEALFSHDEADLDMRLLDASEDEVATATSVDDDETIEYTAERSGPYYVVVHSWSNTTDYEFSVSVDESGNSFVPQSSNTADSDADHSDIPATDSESAVSDSVTGTVGTVLSDRVGLTSGIGPSAGSVAAIAALAGAALVARRRA